MNTTNTNNNNAPANEIFWIKNSDGILHGSDSTLQSYVLSNLVGLLRTTQDDSWRLGWGSVSDFQQAVSEFGYC